MAFNRTIAGLAYSAPDGAGEGYAPAADIRALSRLALPASGPSLHRHDLRLILHRSGKNAGMIEDACREPGCSCHGLRENLLANIHVQDRPAFLKGISDALHEDRPVQVTVRLGDPRIPDMRMQFWPAAEPGIVNALLEPVVASLPGDGAVKDDSSLHKLARTELLELTSLLWVLLRNAVRDPKADAGRMETLPSLQQRLEGVAELLTALDGDAAMNDVQCSLLRLLQDVVDAQARRADERSVAIDIQVAGAVRHRVSAGLAPLLRLMVCGAVDTAADFATVTIVTRREGQAVAIAMTFSAIREMDGNPEQFLLDLAILRNLAIRHGGRLSVLHRSASARQWVLRLPLTEHTNALPAPDDTGGRHAEMSAMRPAKPYSSNMG